MLYRRSGGIGLKVSEITLGSRLTYGNGVEKEAAVQAIDSACEPGISFSPDMPSEIDKALA